LEMPQWRNWQTRYVQGVVGNSPWGFKSLLRHQMERLRAVCPKPFFLLYCRDIGFSGPILYLGVLYLDVMCGAWLWHLLPDRQSNKQ
jgi:hypothetical protein